VYPHAGTAVEPPDAQVPGVSPAREGLGMEEPSAVGRATRLSNLVKTAAPPVVDLPALLAHTPHKVTSHLPQQDLRPERDGYAETAATPADLRLIMGASAARAQGLIEGCRRVRLWASSLILVGSGKFDSRRGKLP
jgi:hypothetical protein